MGRDTPGCGQMEVMLHCCSFQGGSEAEGDFAFHFFWVENGSWGRRRRFGGCQMWLSCHSSAAPAPFAPPCTEDPQQGDQPRSQAGVTGTPELSWIVPLVVSPPRAAVKPGPCPRQHVGAVLGQIIGFPPMSQTWIFGLDVTPIVSAC